MTPVKANLAIIFPPRENVDTPFTERNAPEYAQYSKWIARQRAQAEQWARERLAQEAKAILDRRQTDAK